MLIAYNVPLFQHTFYQYFTVVFILNRYHCYLSKYFVFLALSGFENVFASSNWSQSNFDYKQSATASENIE